MYKFPKSTKTDLVAELKEVLKTADAKRFNLISQIITLAEHGQYHDFESFDFPNPKVTLVYHLEAAGLYGLAHKVKQGEFNEPPTPEQSREIEQQIIDEALKEVGIENPK